MRQSFRTIGLWVVLILLFVFFYNFFSVPSDYIPPGESAPSGASGKREWGWLGWIPLIGIIVLLMYVAGARVRKGMKLNVEGTVLMSRGRYLAALELFETARPLLQKQSPGIVPFNVGVCSLALWRLEAAEREFTAAQKAEGLPDEVRRLIPARLGLVAALRGETKRATQQFADARATNAEDPLLVLGEGVLACRRADWSQARTRLEAPATHGLGGPLRGLRDALLAWSVERRTGERRYVEPVALFGEASTEALRGSWPEFVEFVVEPATQTA